MLIKHIITEGYTVLPLMDREKYQTRKGLEGPFQLRNGKVVYYDPKEGSYYDPDTDMYISYDEYRQMDESEKANENQTPSKYQTYDVFGVNIPANVYDGKYYDYRTVKYTVFKGMDGVETEQDAVNWVNAHRDQVLADLAARRTQSGKLMVAKPAEKNVFFKDNYTVKPSQLTRATDAPPKANFDPTAMTQTQPVDSNPTAQVSEDKAQRVRNRLMAMATDYEQRAANTENPIKKAHFMRMADDTRSKILALQAEQQGMAESAKPKVVLQTLPTAQVSEGKALSMGGALKNALAKAEPGSKLDLSIKAHNNSIRNGGPPTMKNAPTGYHIDKKSYIRLGEQTQPGMQTYLVWGEYGPVAADRIEFKVRAKSPEHARKKAIQELKKTVQWKRIGEHNVYVTLAESAKPKVVLQTMPNRIRGGSNDALYVVISSEHPDFKKGSRITRKYMQDPKNRMRWKSLKDELEFVILPYDKASNVAEDDVRPSYVVSTRDRPKKIKPSMGGESPHPYQGKLVGATENFQKAVKNREASRERAIARAAADLRASGGKKSVAELIQFYELFPDDAEKILQLAGVQREGVTVNSSQYQFSHGKMPRGYGSWFFTRHRRGVDFRRDEADKDYIQVPMMNYADAKREAAKWAREKGYDIIYVGEGTQQVEGRTSVTESSISLGKTTSGYEVYAEEETDRGNAGYYQVKHPDGSMSSHFVDHGGELPTINELSKSMTWHDIDQLDPAVIKLIHTDLQQELI